MLPFAVYLKTRCLCKCTGISFVDSTPFRVCHIKCEYSDKALKGLATKGRCSIGWFFGLKLYLVINDKGEILDFILTLESVDGRQPLIGSNLLAKIYGKFFGDKGYISQSLFDKLFIMEYNY